MDIQLGIAVDLTTDGFRPNGIISASHSTVTVVGVLDELQLSFQGPHPDANDRLEPMPAQLQIDVATRQAPAMWMRIRRIRAGNMGVVAVLEPATAPGEPRRFMHGGAWAECDDPIWLQLTDGASRIRVNDRVEP